LTASFDVLTAGYVGDRVASTVVLLREGDLVAVVDPGMVADRSRILDPLAALGVAPSDVTDVVFSHHHPDHTLNAALFPRARFHDHWAVYQDDVWDDRPAEGTHLTESVWLLETPGHSPQDVSTVARTADGLVVCTHLWWTADGELASALREHAALVAEEVLASGYHEGIPEDAKTHDRAHSDAELGLNFWLSRVRG